MRHIALQFVVFMLLINVANIANASLITVSFDGFTQGGVNIKQTLDGTKRNAKAGMYSMKVVANDKQVFNFNEDDVIEAFCVQIDQFLTVNGDVEYTVMSGQSYFNNASIVNEIAKLYTGFYNDVISQASTTNKKMYSSAFQVALWEIVYDSNSVDLLSDRYQLSATKREDVRAKATSWLGQLGGITSEFDVFVLQSETSQDLLVVNPRFSTTVSEPGALGLFLLTMGLMLRRYYSKKT